MPSAPKTPGRQEVRSCGSCTACCTYLEIRSVAGKNLTFDQAIDIAKPAGKTCQYCTDKGCKIYQNRPIVCREFKCDWLLGRKGFKDSDHPLKVGYIGVRTDRVYFKPDSTKELAT